MRRQAIFHANQFTVSLQTPAVCYLSRKFPCPPPTKGEHVFGGEVKMTYLSESFPHTFPNCNLLYTCSSVSSGVVAPAIVEEARRKGIKVILNQNGVAYPGWHGLGWEETNRPMTNILRQADYVIYQSNFCRLGADKFLGAPSCPWEVIYNPVDIDFFTPASSDPDPDRLVLLLGGGQSSLYRVETALRTVAVLATSLPYVRLLVTGRLTWKRKERDAFAQVQGLIDELGIADKVEFLGPYRQSDAPSIFRKAHILLHTQYNDASPTLVLEAMACGLPVVYSASGGVPELVGEDAGKGVPADLSWEKRLPPDPHELADAVIQVAKQRQTYANAARQRAVEQFSLDGYLTRHKEIFNKLGCV